MSPFYAITCLVLRHSEIIAETKRRDQFMPKVCASIDIAHFQLRAVNSSHRCFHNLANMSSAEASIENSGLITLRFCICSVRDHGLIKPTADQGCPRLHNIHDEFCAALRDCPRLRAPDANQSHGVQFLDHLDHDANFDHLLLSYNQRGKQDVF